MNLGKFALIIFTISILVGMGSVLSYSKEMTGLDVMKLVDSRDDGDNLIQKIHQKLTDKRGSVREREMIAFRKDYGKDSKSISYFLSPSNVRDTALLTYDYAGIAKDDDQWLYLPALKKVRRISSANRGDYFMGTDFTFEDLKQTPELEDYTWTLVGTEIIDGHDCWVVKGEPKTDELKKNLGYSKTRGYIRKDIHVNIRTDYWDRKGQVSKQFTIVELKNITGIWTATKIRMENTQTKHSTEMTFSEQKYNTAISDRSFSERMLKRGYRGN